MTVCFRMLFLSCALAVTGVSHLAAQSLELFGGFKFTNMRPEQNYDNLAMSGWNASATAYVTHRFGFTADVAGYYGSTAPPASASGTGTDLDVRQYSFMGGPEVRLIHRRVFNASAKALFGAAYGYLPDVPSGVAAPSTDGAFDQTKLAALFGADIDMNISRRVALRFSPGVYITQFGQDQTQKSFTISFGPVFRFRGREN